MHEIKVQFVEDFEVDNIQSIL